MFKIEPAKKQAGSSRIMGMPFLGVFGLSHFFKIPIFLKGRGRLINTQVHTMLSQEQRCLLECVPVFQLKGTLGTYPFFHPPSKKKSKIILKFQNIYNSKQCALFVLSPYCNRVYHKPFTTVKCTPMWSRTTTMDDLSPYCNMGTNVEQEEQRKEQILSSILAKNGYKKMVIFGPFWTIEPSKMCVSKTGGTAPEILLEAIYFRGQSPLLHGQQQFTTKTIKYKVH